MLRGPWSGERAVTHWRGSADAADAVIPVPGSGVGCCSDTWALQHGHNTGLRVTIHTPDVLLGHSSPVALYSPITVIAAN